MIMAAISALNEPDGSSKRALSKYIVSQYSDLPSTHDKLLTHHLKRLKINGQLLMVKRSYKLPNSASDGAVNAVPFYPASSGQKRLPGRPPKPKPASVQVAVPVFEPLIDLNAVPVSLLVAEQSQPNVSIGLSNGPAAAGGQPVRSRGRPPKSGGHKQGPGCPPASGEVELGSGSQLESPVRRGGAAADPDPVLVPAAQVKKGPGRPRRRAPKPIEVVDDGLVPPSVPAASGAVGGVAPVAGKRPERQPRDDGEAKRPRNLNGGQPEEPSSELLDRPRKTVNWLNHDKDFLNILKVMRDAEDVGAVCKYDMDFWTRVSHKLSETRFCSLTLKMCLKRANQLRSIYYNHQTQVQLYEHPNMRQSEFKSLLIRVFGRGKPIEIPQLKKNCISCMGTCSGSSYCSSSL